MSADFYFGVVIGMVVVLVALVGLLVWSKSRGDSFAERSLAQLQLRNQLDEDKICVLQGMAGWIAQLVELLRDADEPRCEISPPSAGLAAGAAVACVGWGVRFSSCGGVGDDQGRDRAGCVGGQTGCGG